MAELQLDSPPLPKRLRGRVTLSPNGRMNFKGVLKVWYTSSILTIIYRQHYPIADIMQGSHIVHQISVLLMMDKITHVRGKRDQNMARACSSQSVTSFLRLQTPQSVLQAESLRSMFVISFQTCDHATKLFHSVFLDSEIASYKVFLRSDQNSSYNKRSLSSPLYEENTA